MDINKLSFFIWIFVFNLVLVQTSSATSTASWSPNRLIIELKPGQEETRTVTLRAQQAIESASLQFTPGLSPFITTTPATLSNIAENETVEIQLHFSAPQNAQPKTRHVGILNLKEVNNTLPLPLPIMIKIVPGEGDQNNNGLLVNIQANRTYGVTRTKFELNAAEGRPSIVGEEGQEIARRLGDGCNDSHTEWP